MAHDLTDQYWETEFDITQDDLNRITAKIRESRCAISLSDIALNIIENRIEKGTNPSPAVLAERTGRPSVKTWDVLADWQVGDGVILARDKNLYENDLPPDYVIIIGEIIEIIKINHSIYRVKVKDDHTGDEILYSYNLENDKETRAIREKYRQVITERFLSTDIRDKAEGILLAHPSVGDRVREVLREVDGFIELENKWFLAELTVQIDSRDLKDIHRNLSLSKDVLTPSEIQKKLMEKRPQDELQVFSLHKALLDDKRSGFINEGPKNRPQWRAIKPAPPPWENAVAMYACFDPASYQILTMPGKKVTLFAAKRLQELGLYDAMVEWAEE